MKSDKNIGIRSDGIITTMLVLLSRAILSLIFMYSAFSKVIDWNGTRSALHNQVFPGWMAETLLFTLPVVELVTAILLLGRRSFKNGFVASTLLMVCFTVYVGWVMSGAFGRIPCTCGGLISELGWSEHLLLNLVLVVVSFLGLMLSNKISV
ncbi:MauE/DoxX family redox-associated membrane protein [Fontibacter flavus]|uniref:MauE/DoxX family redox-associated membrane protein n=2 Tax=Fontibacter flavus TaxID=654838 RepID=A0ABV6FNF1_9BACT